MSTDKETREMERVMRRRGLDVVTKSRHVKVRKPGDAQLLGVIPKTPGSQRSVMKSMRITERIIRGEPVRPESDNHGPNTPGKVTRDPQEQAPPPRPERPLKERFVPESQDVGRLGYSPEEIFDRMPAPAPPKPRRPFVSKDSDPLGYMRWISQKRQMCLDCENDARPELITILHCDQSEPAFLQTCTERLHMPAEKAAYLARMTRQADGQGYLLQLCSSCVQRAGLLGGVPQEAFGTVADLANPDVAATKRLLTLHEPLPAAFRPPAAVSRPPLKPHPIITAAHQQVADETLKKMLGGQGVTRPRRKAKRKRRKH